MKNKNKLFFYCCDFKKYRGEGILANNFKSFLKKKTDYRVTQFFKTLNHEHYEIQNELFSLYCLALLAKYEFTEKTKTPNKWCLQPFLSDMLPKFLGIGLKKSLLHKFFADYKDIELSFLQICTLQFFTCGSD